MASKTWKDEFYTPSKDFRPEYHQDGEYMLEYFFSQTFGVYYIFVYFCGANQGTILETRNYQTSKGVYEFLKAQRPIVWNNCSKVEY